MSRTLYCDTCEEYIDIEMAFDKEFICPNRVYCPISETLSDDKDYKELDFND